MCVKVWVRALQTAELVLNLQAFVELGSVDQAKDLVKLYKNQPITVNGQQVEFKMSHTFSFLQVSFSPSRISSGP